MSFVFFVWRYFDNSQRVQRKIKQSRVIYKTFLDFIDTIFAILFPFGVVTIISSYALAQPSSYVVYGLISIVVSVALLIWLMKYRYSTRKLQKDRESLELAIGIKSELIKYIKLKYDRITDTESKPK